MARSARDHQTPYPNRGTGTTHRGDRRPHKDTTTTAGTTKPVHKARRIGTDGNKYFVGTKATRTVTATDSGKTVAYAKKGGDTITKTVTKAGGAKNTRVGAYARAHATTNADGTVTYAKKGGGTVTVGVSASEGAKKAKKQGRRRSTSTTGSTGSAGAGSAND